MESVPLTEEFMNELFDRVGITYDSEEDKMKVINAHLERFKTTKEFIEFLKEQE